MNHGDQGKGICPSCKNYSGILISKNTRKMIWFCEEFGILSTEDIIRYCEKFIRYNSRTMNVPCISNGDLYI
jgi:ssDNA-binding Zn-finger/Zn-ribbon topoisomerase 1